MGYGESKFVDTLNAKFESDGINAIAYRQKQSRFAAQYCDVNVDSILPEYYLAVEIKAKRGKRALSFNHDFTTDINSQHQLDRQIEFARLSGRYPIVHLICRMGCGRENIEYTFRSSDLKQLMDSGKTSILARQFDEYNMGSIFEYDFIYKRMYNRM